MQAITTKFIGPTNCKGARIKATADAGSITLSWDYELTADCNHIAAAKALVEKLDWGGQWFMGGVMGADNVFVKVTDWRGAMLAPAFDAGQADKRRRKTA